MLSKKHQLHERVLANLCVHLRQRRIPYRRQKVTHCHFDVWVNGQFRVELKVATSKVKQGKIAPLWLFNLHRSGKIDPRHVHFYVLYCIVPGSRAGIFLVVPSPILKGKYSAQMTLRQIALKWAKWWNRFDLLAKQR